MRKGADIAERLMRVAVAALGILPRLPKDAAGRHIAVQLARCATGGGSNYEEARAAESRDDFVHKVGVAAKEVREAVYWLTLVQRCGWTKFDLHPLVIEAQELAAILAASIRTARSNSPRP
jgi:four helix bundle protein